MYNRYLNHDDYVLIDSEPEPENFTPPNAATAASKPSSLLGEMGGGITQVLRSVFKHFSLENLDTGDILLVLIILFLFLEGDNLELVITLGLMLLLGLGED